MDVAEKNKVIFVNFGAESDFLTGKNFTPYMFRTCFTTTIVRVRMPNFFQDQTLAEVYLMNQDYAFGHAVADDFKKVISKEIPDAKLWEKIMLHRDQGFRPLHYEDPGQRGRDHFYRELWSRFGDPDEAGSPDGIKASNPLSQPTSWMMTFNSPISAGRGGKFCKQHLSAHDRHPAEQGLPGKMEQKV